MQENEERKVIAGMKTQPKRFYSFAKKQQSKTKHKILSMKKPDGSTSSDDYTLCNLLNQQYQSVWSNPKTEYLIEDPNKFFDINTEFASDGLLRDCIFTENDMKKALSKTKPDS